MIKVENKSDFTYLFQPYTHNIPVIYSSLEGQYNGELYVDSENSPQIAVLFTPFGFHFVAGNSDYTDIIDEIDQIVFLDYLPRTGQKEAIFFSPDEKWDRVLEVVFKRHQGIKDGRNIFQLNKDRFREILKNHSSAQSIEQKIVFERENGATIAYPVCRIYIENQCVSFCSAFMLGKGRAEIDVFTEELHRGKGYAKEAALMLISILLENHIEPDWCTWPYRVESKKLAYSLGYELKEIVPAHIWFKES